MRTAVLISGQARSFGEVYQNQKWFLYRKLPDPHFFVSVTDDAQAKDMERLRADFKNVYIEKVTQPEIAEPSSILTRHSGYPLSAPIQSVLKQLWHLNRVWDHYLETAAYLRPGEYDIFVRFRPDLKFHSFDMPYLPLQEKQSITPFWSKWGGINDRLAFFGAQAAETYFTTFIRLHEILGYGCPLHPETIMKASLENDFIHISHNLRALFSTVRLDGTVVPPDITAHDLADLCLT